MSAEWSDSEGETIEEQTWKKRFRYYKCKWLDRISSLGCLQLEHSCRCTEDDEYVFHVSIFNQAVPATNDEPEIPVTLFQRRYIYLRQNKEEDVQYFMDKMSELYFQLS